jgi:anaerobic magnesium-protoporphyrin IX monomethyl ester cyclase
MRILAANPPFLPKFSREQRSPAVTKSGTLYYPMWLAYAVGALEDAGHECMLIDGPAEPRWTRDSILKHIASSEYDLAIVDTSTPTIANDAGFATAIKKASPDTIVVLVGPHVSALPEETLEEYEAVDGVLRGEYETTAVVLADVLSAGGNVTDIDGGTWRVGDEIVSAPNRPLTTDLDGFPYVSTVYKKFLDIRNYFYSHSRYPIVTILSARGCPYRCSFCVYPQVFSGREYRTRSIGNVIGELKYIKGTWPELGELMFEDDTFSVNHERTRGLCGAMLDEGISLAWSANARADLDYGTLKTMREAGCRLLCVGIESGDDSVLEGMGKRIDRERIEQFFADAKRAGILIHGCFMVGNRGETRKTMEKTLDFARRLKPDTAQFFPIMVYPGTDMYEWAEQLGYLKTGNFSDWLTDGGLHNCVVDLPGLPATEIVAFCDRARRRFYLSPGYLFYKLKQSLTHPREFGRTVKSARTFLKHLIKNTG